MSKARSERDLQYWGCTFARHLARLDETEDAEHKQALRDAGAVEEMERTKAAYSGPVPDGMNDVLEQCKWAVGMVWTDEQREEHKQATLEKYRVKTELGETVEALQAEAEKETELAADADPAAPFTNRPQWGADSHSVVFLGDTHWRSWRKSNPQALALFYAPWCGHCKKAKPHFGKASKEVATPFVAVDCTGTGRRTCQEYGVDGYPTILWLDGDEKEDYASARSQAAFAAFVKSRAK